MAFLTLLPLLRGLARSFAGKNGHFGRVGANLHELRELVVGVFGRLLGAWALGHLGTSGHFSFVRGPGNYPALILDLGTRSRSLLGVKFLRGC